GNSYNAQNPEVFVSFDLPVALSFSVTERFYLGGTFGLYAFDFDRVDVRGGGHVGYSVGSGRPLVDIVGTVTVHGRRANRFGFLYGTGLRWELSGGIRMFLGV
ncbi:MAG: hypothetical protein AAF411_28860, partial [Myxococcota bacterium]